MSKMIQGPHDLREGVVKQANTTAPVRFTLLTSASLTVVSASVGRFHMLLVAATGQLFSFGHGSCGRLGHGDHESRFVPTLVRDLPNGVQCASAGFAHSVAIVDGAIWSWGKVRTRGRKGGSGKVTGSEASETASHRIRKVNSVWESGQDPTWAPR